MEKSTLRPALVLQFFLQYQEHTAMLTFGIAVIASIYDYPTTKGAAAVCPNAEALCDTVEGFDGPAPLPS
jgi:hypothetical protein